MGTPVHWQIEYWSVPQERWIFVCDVSSKKWGMTYLKLLRKSVQWNKVSLRLSALSNEEWKRVQGHRGYHGAS